MIDQTIYEDQFIRIFTQSNDVLVESFRPGLAPEKVNKIISSFHKLKLPALIVLRCSNQRTKAPSKIRRVEGKTPYPFLKMA